MSNEKYENADYIENEVEMKKLTPFKMFTLTKFPFIEETFDALNNYQLLCKIVEYLNNVIENENNVTSNTHNLYNAYLALQIHVNDYFENLDVTDEINNKLDEMTINGSLTTLIKKYIDPIYNEFNNEINNEINIQNSEIIKQNNEIEVLKTRMNQFTNLESRFYIWRC